VEAPESLQSRLLSLGIAVPAIRPNQKIHPGTKIEAPAQITKTVHWGAPVKVGAFSMIHGPGTMGFIEVGRYCSIAPHTVLGANEHAHSWLSTTSLLENPDVLGWSELAPYKSAERYRRFAHTQALRRITIGHDVWIGHDAFIRGGVEIGHGAVVGAKAVVTKDVPPYAIVGGSPARIIRYRFPDELIEQFLDIQWWNYSIYDLLQTGIDLSEPKTAIAHIREFRDAGRLRLLEPEVLTASDLEKYAEHTR